MTNLKARLYCFLFLGVITSGSAQQLIYDFGDAPTNYPTLLSAGGARHKTGGQLYLGLAVDVEKDGQPSALANGDDTAGLDDEDGVTFASPIVPGFMARVNVLVTGRGRLDAWLDFNRNLNWEPAEKIFNSVIVSNGMNPLSFFVPTNAVYGRSYARFRLSTAGGLGTGGPAADGEVEDYAVNIVRTNGTPVITTSLSLSSATITDGDAAVMTLAISNTGGDALGILVTNRSDSALVSDPGVVITSTCANGGPSLWNLDANSNQWISLDSLPGGCSVSVVSTVRVDSVRFNSLSGTNELLTLSSRYDVSTSFPLYAVTNWVPSITITVSNLTVKSKMDYGDAPDTYHTTFLSNGARHRATPQVCLGHYVDAESDGIPSARANSDDLIGTTDDEDGIVFLTPIVPGGTATNRVIVTGGGKLDAWVDFNHDGTFGGGEQIYFSVPVPAGTNYLSFPVPGTAVIGQTYARFRLSTSGGLTPFGYATDGEVEDYWVAIGNSGMPNLSVSLAPSAPTTTCTSNLSFTLTVANNGPGSANDILVSLLLPNFHIVQNLGPGSFTNTLGGETAYLPTLQQNGSAIITVNGFFDVFDFSELAPPGLANLNDGTVTVAASASVSSSAPDPMPADNFAFVPITVTNLLDYGDAPTHLVPWNYPTLLVDDGARHAKSTNYLGAHIDYEPNGAPSLNADGDDVAGVNDEDGAVWSALTRGSLGSVTVTPTANGFVNVWLDFAGNGTWADPGDHVIVDAFVPGGVPTTLNFHVPATGYTGTTYGRVRYCTYRGLSFNGYARNGEVIDRKLTLLSPLKSGNFGISPRGQATLSANGDTISVSNLGTDGQDGLYVRAEEVCAGLPPSNPCWATNAACQHLEFDLAGLDLAPEGSKLYLRSRGYYGTNQTLAVLGGLRFWRTNGVLTYNNTTPVILPPDVTPVQDSSPFMLRVQVFAPTGYVGKVIFDSTAAGVFGGAGNPVHGSATAFGRPALAVMFNAPMSFTIANQTLTGTTFRFSPADYIQARDRGSLDYTGDPLMGGLDDNDSVTDAARLLLNNGSTFINHTFVRDEYLASAFEEVAVSGYTPTGSFTVTENYVSGLEFGVPEITDFLQNVPLAAEPLGHGIQFTAPGVFGAEYQIQSCPDLMTPFADVVGIPGVCAAGTGPVPVGTVSDIKIEHEGLFRVRLAY